MAKYAINSEGVSNLRGLAHSLLFEVNRIVDASRNLERNVRSLDAGLGIYDEDVLDIVESILAIMRRNYDGIKELSNSILAKANEITELFDLGEADDATSSAIDNAFTERQHHLSRDEVNAYWQLTVQNVDGMIENYKEELLLRGVPEGAWLSKTLATHRAQMLEQEGYNLDVASGHSLDTIHSDEAYKYPEDYSSFYDGLAEQFRSYCLEGTNPNYSSGPEWQNNCQRCVPTYELRRRGIDVTVYPSTQGTEHLVHYPFDVWENPQILSGGGNGRSDIEQALSFWGDGARAQVVVVWNDGFGINGHTFIAEQRDGRTFYFDPQNNDNDVSSYFDDVVDGHTQFCRIDNLNVSPYINDCCEREGKK